MTISAIGSRAGIIPASVNKPQNGIAFDRAMASASTGSQSLVTISPTAQALSESSSHATSQSTDYANMTPRQFSDAAQSMYDDGKISLDQLFKMQMASGIVGDTVLTTTPGQPMDFAKYFQDQLAGQVSRGDVNGKGYQDTLTILGLLTGKA